MKILCVSQRFSPAIGGAEQVVENLVNFLSKKHDITVYTTNAMALESFWDPKGKTVDNPEQKKYEIKRYPILQPGQVPEDFYEFPFSIHSPGPFCPTMWNDLLDLEEHFDIIVATAFPYDHIIPAFLASKKYKIPIIMIPHLHLEFPELYFTGLQITLLSRSDAIVVNTKTEKNALLKYNIPANKINVIPPAINTEYAKKYLDIKKTLNIDKNSITVLFAGTKSYAKGAINLIESMKIMWDASDEFNLLMFGPATTSFHKYMKKLDSKYLAHIHDMGLVSDKTKWDSFNSCDIFALPSKSESFGISYLEAWLHKKPVIGCDIGAIRDLIDDNVNGLLVNFENINQLSNAILKLKNSDLRMKLGNNGYGKLNEMYNLEKNCAQFEELCISLCRN